MLFILEVDFMAWMCACRFTKMFKIKFQIVFLLFNDDNLKLDSLEEINLYFNFKSFSEIRLYQYSSFEKKGRFFCDFNGTHIEEIIIIIIIIEETYNEGYYFAKLKGLAGNRLARSWYQGEGEIGMIVFRCHVGGKAFVWRSLKFGVVEKFKP